MTKNDSESTGAASPKANKKTLNDEVILDSQINEADILCGKEKHCVSHPGSLNFRAVIDKYASKYQEAVTKQEKMNVTKEIYDTLGSQNSRFLKYNANSKGWEELSSLLARDKISHALRFANREKKQAPTTTTTTKPRASKKGHRRSGSDASTDTLTTAATELSVEDFECLMDSDEPLDFSNLPDDEPKPYVYPVYERAPPSPPTAAVYHHSYGHPPYYPHPHHAYGHGGYYHPRSYHHHHSYHHHQHHQHYSHPTPAPHARQPPMTHTYETMEPPMNFPEEKPYTQSPARENGMDIDLSYLVAEPLMDFELEPEQVRMVNDQ